MMNQNESGNNPLFDLVLEEEAAQEGCIDECKKIIANVSGLKLLNMNVCGINSKYEKIEILFKALNADFDIIVLTEAHLKGIVILEQFNFQGYKVYSTENNKFKTDGVLLYVKTTVEHTVQEIKMENCTCLELKFLVDKKLFSCIAIYRSPSGGIERFIEQLEQVL